MTTEVAVWNSGSWQRMRSNRLERHDKETGKYRLGWAVLCKRSRGDGNTGAEQNANLT